MLVGNRVLWKLVATDTAVSLVPSVAHLVHRVNGEQSSGIALLIRIRKVKGAVDDQRAGVIPSEDPDKEALHTKRMKKLLDVLPIRFCHVDG
jgi:hypothetical protein